MERCGEHKVSRNDCVALTECGLRPVLNVNASVVHDMMILADQDLVPSVTAACMGVTNGMGLCMSAVAATVWSVL